MRLRPYGDSGPLACRFVALEQYLVTQGRAWERYAWLKARAAHRRARHDELAAIVDAVRVPQIPRLRRLRGPARHPSPDPRAGRRRDYAPNVKLGPGGIREIEFIVQALQIVRGGREPALRVRGTLPALPHRARAACCPRRRRPRCSTPTCSCATSSTGCNTATTRRRRAAARTPRSATRSPRAMGFADRPRSTRALAAHRARSARAFRARVRRRRADGGADPPARRAGLRRRPLGADERRERPARSPRRASRIRAALARPRRACARSPRYLQLPALSRQRFDALVPQLLRGRGEAGPARTRRLCSSACRPAGGHQPPQRLPRAAGRAPAAAAAPCPADGRLAVGGGLPRRCTRCCSTSCSTPACSRRARLGGLAARARAPLAAPPATPSARWTSLRHFQHAQPFRLLAQDLAGQLYGRAARRPPVGARRHHPRRRRSRRAGRSCSGAGRAAAALRRHRLRQAGRQGTGLRLRPRPRLPLRRRATKRRRSATRASRSALVTWLTSTTAAGALYDTDLRLRPDGASGPAGVVARRASAATSASRPGPGSTRR